MHADAHIHFVDLKERDPGFHARFIDSGNMACAASHDEGEFLETESLAALSPPGKVVLSFGIHPQWAVWKNAGFLARLADERRIAAIGEAGFDFFGDRPERVRNDENEKAQKAVFEYQLGLAERHGLPLLLHLRRATDLLFAYSGRLSRLSSVIIHSYPCTAREGEDLLRRGVPAWFSFGASILNGHKKAVEACARLPAERLLSETDAPWQPPRGLEFCPFEAIERVVDGMADLRGEDPATLRVKLAANFRAAYFL